jgi:hypothetical protein
MPVWHSEENGSARAQRLFHGLYLIINDAFFGGDFELGLEGQELLTDIEPYSVLARGVRESVSKRRNVEWYPDGRFLLMDTSITKTSFVSSETLQSSNNSPSSPSPHSYKSRPPSYA